MSTTTRTIAASKLAPKAPKAPPLPAAKAAPKAPAAPVQAPKAPKASPAAPPAVQAAPKAPKAPAMPSAAPVVQAPKASAAPAAPGLDVAKLAKENEQLRAQLAKLAKASKGLDTYAPASIYDGAPKLEKGDWRTPFVNFCKGDEHGPRSVLVRPMDPKGNVIPGAAPVRGYLAIPRDNDKGGQGPSYRSMGNLAFHWQTTESGELTGAPGYFSAEEFAAAYIGDGE